MDDRQKYRDMFKRHPLARTPHGRPPSAACEIGWLPLIDAALTELDAFGVPYAVRQIKQKLGDLRLYIFSPEELSEDDQRQWTDIIDLAEARSRYVCEVCGKPGKLRRWDPGPLKTVCDEHAVDEYDGRIAEPVPDATLYRGSYCDGATMWAKYDPAADAWVPSEEPPR
ncbi:hypothetical protein OS035_24300 [Rhizobium sp. 268]|uniref:hypothetical protein n=1 Tax=Rhizobium sp. 268 TaxID=2996375 RepID=UPI002F928A66